MRNPWTVKNSIESHEIWRFCSYADDYLIELLTSKHFSSNHVIQRKSLGEPVWFTACSEWHDDDDSVVEADAGILDSIEAVEPMNTF